MFFCLKKIVKYKKILFTFIEKLCVVTSTTRAFMKLKVKNDLPLKALPPAYHFHSHL